MSSDGLKVIIVGAGFCGMVAAIECKLSGMRPLLIETYPTSRTQGDVIDFFPNGGRVIQSWDNGRIGKQLLDICINNCERFNFYSHDGQFLVDDAWLQEPHHFERQFAGHRGEVHETMMNYAKEIGVEFHFRETVVEYLDNENELGVLTKSGKKFLGDVVLAADGPRSLARSQVLGLPDNKVNSGYAIYRAFYSLTDEHRKDPLMKEFVNPDKDTTAMWVGRDLHALVYTWNKGRDLSWVLTHKDDQDIGESWSFPGRKEDVIQYLDDGKFEERLKKLVEYTPDASLIDYKLVWRAPLATWLPKSARILVMGDAAHCHLPTSGQGGSQSIEDGASIAVCLRRANGDVKLALRAFERIRYNRTHVVHMSSVSNRNEYHNVDWTPQFVKDHPGSLSLRRPVWIVEHDAKKFAEENFEKVAEDIRSGKKGTLVELSLPAEGQIMEVDAQGIEKAVRVQVETIDVQVS